jgi:hypothetical protein
MKKLCLLALLVAVPAFAAKHSDSEYQLGRMVSFHTEQSGRHCTSSEQTNGNVNAYTDDSGNTSGTVRASSYGSSSCTPITKAYYTVKVGDNTFVLTPAVSAAKVGVALVTLGIGTAFMKNSVLYGTLPGTPILVRSENGTFYVKVGKRESDYKLAAAN